MPPDPTGPLEPDEEIIARINACAEDNPCEASWQASYAYAADKAYELAVYQALTTIAFGVMQYASADRTADQQYDIADRQMVIAEEEYARYKELFIPCEEAFVEEQCAIEKPTAEYAIRANRITRDVRKQFAIERQKLGRARRRFCLADYAHDLLDMSKAEALAVVAARSAAYREAEERHDLLDAKRWDKRTWAINLGREVMTGQSGIYTSGAGMAYDAVGARGNAMRNLLGTLSGAVSAIMTANYAPQINAPSIMGGVGPGWTGTTHWGNFDGRTIQPYNQTRG